MTFQSAGVILKIRSRSPKSNHQFLFSQQCIYASLIKIYQLAQKITHGNHILDISSAGVTLKLSQGHQNIIYYTPAPNNVSLQVC